MTTKIPLFPLGLVLLPKMSLPLHIFEERYKLMMSECLADDHPFGIVWFDGQSMHATGCMARITSVIKQYEDGRMDILTRGEQRFLVQELIEDKSYTEAQVVFFDDADKTSSEDVKEILQTAYRMIQQLIDEEYLSESIDQFDFSDPRNLSFAIAAIDGFNHSERQRFLENTSGADRLQKCVAALAHLMERYELNREINRIIGGNGQSPKILIEKLKAAKDIPDNH